MILIWLTVCSLALVKWISVQYVTPDMEIPLYQDFLQAVVSTNNIPASWKQLRIKLVTHQVARPFYRYLSVDKERAGLIILMLRLNLCLRHKNSKEFENHLNPVMLVFIGKVSLSTDIWVPICQCFSHFSALFTLFCIDQISHQQLKVSMMPMLPLTKQVLISINLHIDSLPKIA